MDKISAMPRQFDVIITAGDRAASRPVLQKNKVFLPIAGIPVINYVLSAVERARCTARIIVVGDQARLEEALTLPNNPFQGQRPLTVLEQSNTICENVWNAFLHTLPGYQAGMDWHSFSDANADKAVLVMSGDIPLATPEEIEEFVDSCDLTRYDYFLGLTTEATLRPYYPQAERSGVRMAYFTLRDLQVRQNNLHLVKPFRVGNLQHIQRAYEVRYQKEWRNVAKLIWQMVAARDVSLRTFGAIASLHVARLISRFGWQSIPLFRPFFLDLPMLASLASQLLRTRFTTVMTHYGGCTIDVDNAEHYQAICANFTNWLKHQALLAQELKQQA